MNKSREKINSSLFQAKQAFIEYKKILNWVWAQAAHYLLDHKQLISGQTIEENNSLSSCAYNSHNLSVRGETSWAPYSHVLQRQQMYPLCSSCACIPNYSEFMGPMIVSYMEEGYCRRCRRGQWRLQTENVYVRNCKWQKWNFPVCWGRWSKPALSLTPLLFTSYNI